MAKQAQTNGTTETKTENKKLTKEQFTKLFSDYDSADKEYQAAAKALQAAKEKRSGIVQALFAGMGSKGPYKHPKSGVQLTIVERKVKDEEGKDTGDSNWYFKGPSSSDVIDVSQL